MMTDQTSEIKRLSTLLEVSQALSGTLNLKAALHRVLEILEQQHSMIRSAVMLLHEDGDELTIEAANGITADGQRQRYRVGEGIVGRVVESGKPIVVPQVSREPLFLHRAARRNTGPGQEVSFICVPVLIGRQAVGAL